MPQSMALTGHLSSIVITSTVSWSPEAAICVRSLDTQDARGYHSSDCPGRSHNTESPRLWEKEPFRPKSHLYYGVARHLRENSS